MATDVDAVLSRVVADLGVDQVDRLGVGRAAVRVAGRDMELRVVTRGRFLLRVTETTFVVAGPDWDPARHGPVVLRVGHRGVVRRTGTRVQVARGGAHARRLAAALDADGALDTALRPLDFTDVTVVEEDGRLVARLTLMGASMTRMRLPPTTTYVRLHDDQRAALLATTDALASHWASA